jgi:hypothetical protein
MLVNGKRELAYIVNIDEIRPIEGSDNCECAVVGGWHIMTRKGTFKAGDKAVYFEIDSKLPETDWSQFLIKKHFKVKTQKYTFGGKGNFVSQGLLMAFEDFAFIDFSKIGYEVGTPLTDVLGVTYSVAEDNKRKRNIDKYFRMKQRHAELFKKNKLVQWLYKRTWGKKVLFFFLGKKRDAKAAYWPTWVVKTDEERVQNLPQLFPPDDTEWFVTEKIDGTSTTFTMKKKRRKNDYEFYVCSRNVCFDKPEKEAKLFYDTNVYTEMALRYNIEFVLHDLLYTSGNDVEFVTIQGETYGKGVQQRDYHMNNVDFMAFNLIFGFKDGTTQRLNPREMTDRLDMYEIPCVPILDEHFKLPNTIDEMVAYAEGDSKIDGDYREGVVLRTADGVNSFKAVSNFYLCSKYGNN